MVKLSIVDDGTLDTVFECESCGETIRYDSDGIERDDLGDVTDAELARVASEHGDDCEGPSDLGWRTLAGQYHGGQWSALYAYASSGTPTFYLSREVRESIELARKQDAHPLEVEALQALLEWADAQTYPEEE